MKPHKPKTGSQPIEITVATNATGDSGQNSEHGVADAKVQLTALTLAVVGIGQMGLALALRLRDCGHVLRVHDLAAERCRLAQEEDLTVCSHAAVAAQGCAALVVAVVDAAQTEAVLFGPGGAAAALAPGSAVLLCATIGPADTEVLALRLQALGLQAIDAPMSGGPLRARQGRMSLMVACAQGVWARWQPLLQQMAEPVFHVGHTAGAGARTKLVNNLLAAINLAGACEAIALAEKMGLDAATTLQVVEASSGQSWIGSDRLRRALDASRPLDAPPLAQTALLAKDSTLALQAARQAGVEPLLGALAQQLFAQACAAGLGAADDSALLGWMRGLAVTSKLPGHQDR